MAALGHGKVCKIAQVQTCGSTGRGVVLVHDRHMNMCAYTTRWRYWDLAYMIKDPCATIPWHWITADTGTGALTTAWHGWAWQSHGCL